MQSLKWPELFWVSACAPLASVIISTLVVFLFKAENHGISIVRPKNAETVSGLLLVLQQCANQDILNLLVATDWAAQVWPEPPLMGQANI